MRIEIDFSKKLEQNAQAYFDQSKKAKKKLKGLLEAITRLEKEVAVEQQKKELREEKKTIVKKRRREWFEKFHWFFSSDNLLVIGGKDATSNDALVKKMLDESDLYFHADIVGAPHCIVKTTNNQAPSVTKKEAAAFAVIFSRAWQSGIPFADAYWVLPSQVSKKAPSGESIGKGAFMIYGERNYERKIALECGVGLQKVEGNWRVISGPLSAISKHGQFVVKLVPGETEKGVLAKKLLNHFKHHTQNQVGSVSLDEIIQMLPTGKSRLILF